MVASTDRFARVVMRIVLLSAVVTAPLAFQAGRGVVDDDLRGPVIASLVALIPYGAMLLSTFLAWHPRMNRRGILLLLWGISLLSIAEITILGMFAVSGPPDPDTAGHLRSYIWPILFTGCLIIITVIAMAVGAKQYTNENPSEGSQYGNRH